MPVITHRGAQVSGVVVPGPAAHNAPRAGPSTIAPTASFTEDPAPGQAGHAVTARAASPRHRHGP
jgi:hypothetical protein